MFLVPVGSAGARRGRLCPLDGFRAWQSRGQGGENSRTFRGQRCSTRGYRAIGAPVVDRGGHRGSSLSFFAGQSVAWCNKSFSFLCRVAARLRRASIGFQVSLAGTRVVEVETHVFQGVEISKSQLEFLRDAAEQGTNRRSRWLDLTKAVCIDGPGRETRSVDARRASIIPLGLPCR